MSNICRENALPRSDITYEELTHYNQFKILHHKLSYAHVGHYLWGIDTFNICNEKALPKKILSDITYEELTLIHSNEGAGRFYSANSSDITYEELTQISISNICFSVNFHFETDKSDITYEELTQDCLLIIIPFLLMHICVGHYLWGIDTVTRMSSFS